MKPLAVAALAAVSVLTLAAQPAAKPELKLDDIIQKNIDAQGGLEKMRAIKSVKLTGKMIIGGGQMEAPLTIYMRRPHSNRTEIELPGQLIVDAYDGTTKWTINPMTGNKNPQKAPEDETKAAADDSDILEGPLVDYKEKGSTLELQGKEDVAGSMAYKIKVAFKSGRTRLVFVDEKSFLVVKEVAQVKQMGQEFEAETVPSNYKMVNGVMIPFSSEMKVNQQVGMQMQFEKVEMNVPVEDALFAFPEVKKAEPPKVQ